MITTSKEDVERMVAETWEQLVGESEDDRSNFFVAGGNSLHVIKASMRLSRLLGITIKPALLFDNPVLSDFKRAVLNSAEEASVIDGPGVSGSEAAGHVALDQAS